MAIASVRERPVQQQGRDGTCFLRHVFWRHAFSGERVLGWSCCPAAARPRTSDGLKIYRRCLASLPLLQVEADLLALIEAGEPRTFDGRDVNEHILRSVPRLDEAVALLRIEPFDRAFRDRVISSHFGDPPDVDPESLSIGGTEARRGRIGKVR